MISKISRATSGDISFLPHLQTKKLDECHLAKILELTREQFSKFVLDRVHLRKEYFNDEGKILFPFCIRSNFHADEIHF